MVDLDDRVPWEVVEMGAVAVLLSTLLLVIGGVAAGIISGAHAPDSAAVVFGAQWAEPLLGMILLGLVGMSWWQHTGWMGAYDDSASGSEVAVHLGRFRRIGFWAQFGLCLAVAGSASAFGALVASDLSFSAFSVPVDIWNQAVFAGASFLALTVLAAAGLFIGRKFRAAVGAEALTIQTVR